MLHKSDPFRKMYSFKHNVVMNAGCDWVKLTQEKKRDHQFEMGHDSQQFCFCYTGPQFTGYPTAKTVKASFNSAETKCLNPSQREAFHKNTEKQMFFPETMKT